MSGACSAGSQADKERLLDVDGTLSIDVTRELCGEGGGLLLVLTDASEFDYEESVADSICVNDFFVKSIRWISRMSADVSDVGPSSSNAMSNVV